VQLITYQQRGQARCGALVHGKLVDLQRAARLFYKADDRSNRWSKEGLPDTMLGFLAGGRDVLQKAVDVISFVQMEIAGTAESFRRRRILFDLKEVKLLAPVPYPGKIICVGGNYPSSASRLSPPEYPILFLKPSSSVTGAGQPIKIPAIAHNVAYEVELAVVIGNVARNLPIGEAFSCVIGYMVANDLGDRELEKRTSQWTTGKMLDSFTPLGPALVTYDEVPEPGRLTVRTFLNGKMVQQGNTADMYFDIPNLISYITSLTTLVPGDIVLTGSPKIMREGPAPNIDLRPGDFIEVEIAGLGRLSNPVIEDE
jgi:acylpyruvate hydrolase